MGVRFVIGDDLVEDALAFFEGVGFFKFVGDVVTARDALDGLGRGEIKDEKEAGGRRKGFVHLANVIGVETTDALIGHGGVVVAVEDDNFAIFETF